MKKLLIEELETTIVQYIELLETTALMQEDLIQNFVNAADRLHQQSTYGNPNIDRDQIEHNTSLAQTSLHTALIFAQRAGYKAISDETRREQLRQVLGRAGAVVVASPTGRASSRTRSTSWSSSSSPSLT